ncbi:MAG: sigma-70 family RNA polymerase sigma factor [Abitibacteriaceae bacterium]|nr:sigma-70 family RNA polymerase sigma factor [Abditibacteriaceae bacterium]MBV9867479.1 sigma-70 family RNA polymerase sigma factor [Abditibacteriaceae bacterium]
MQDTQLLKEYLEQGSQTAFTSLVERYVNLVYTVCLREVGDPQLAEDVTQVVFIILANKAHTIREGTVLSGWLFNTARFASKNALKQESRRHYRERKAAEEMIRQLQTKEASWEQLEPILQDAMASLSQEDRNAVLLRFFEGKSLRDTGDALGVTEDAARMRVSRALNKLRGYFSRHGFVVSIALIAALLTDNAVQAAPVTCVSATLHAASCAAATATAGAGHITVDVVGVNVHALWEGVVKTVWLTKIKATASALLTLILVGKGAVALARLTATPQLPAIVSTAGLTVAPSNINKTRRNVGAGNILDTQRRLTSSRPQPTIVPKAVSHGFQANLSPAIESPPTPPATEPGHLRFLPTPQPSDSPVKVLPAYKTPQHKASPPVVPAGMLPKTVALTTVQNWAQSLSAAKAVSQKASLAVTLPVVKPARPPHIAKGWPVVLPGSVTGTPVVANLGGDGQLEVVAPCMHREDQPGNDFIMAHPQPDLAAQVFALHADGTPLEGWPIVLMDAGQRKRERELRPLYADMWASSPSVVDIGNKGHDEIVMLLPSLQPPWVIWGDGNIFTPKFQGNTAAWSSVPIVDLNRDGVMDMVCGGVLSTIMGKPVPDWPEEKRIKGGYAPCIGDANGDGEPEIYHPFYAEQSMLGGYDRFGNRLPGWPQKIGSLIMYPVMGDVTGDDKMEVCGTDSRGNVHLWTWDGKPLPATHPEGEFTSVFKTGIHALNSCPTLADLDGDGKAEIILFNPATNKLMGWHGDGTSVVPANPDGTIIDLPGLNCYGGVAVADLGNDGIMDLFVGTCWVQLTPDGKATVTDMLPNRPPTTTQPTITDIDRDGKADILFGLTDGRLYVYNTEKAYKPEWVQWATHCGNFQHTSAWYPPTRHPPTSARLAQPPP